MASTGILVDNFVDLCKVETSQNIVKKSFAFLSRKMLANRNDFAVRVASTAICFEAKFVAHARNHFSTPHRRPIRVDN